MSMLRRSVRPLALTLAGACAAALLAAQPAFARQTGAEIPTVRQTLGYDSGQEISRAADVRRYFEALKTAAPTQVVLGDYARTWEGRPLFWAAVGSPANIARLNQIKANARALADPRATSTQQASNIIADQPVIVWMAYSVHGNEISPADASMEAARRLLTDPTAQAWLANTVVVFVPTQNPDGRERFLNSFASGRGSVVNPDPASAERDEPWPSGRYNHYLFDLNRDWFIQTQPETQGHSAQVRDWRPQVVVDSHEMGSDETFFFPPEAEPLNPWIWPRTLENRALFGRNTGARFDAAGLPYFNRKVYDAFYPGYGDGWPGYLGAVSMTYEAGSARGLAARRSSGEVFTYADTVRAHLTATLATIETASRNHDRLLNDFYAYHRDGMSGRGAYVLPRAKDPAAADRLAGLLVRSGIEVGVARQAFGACGGQYRAGDYLVNLSQPQRRMAEVLLTRDVPIPPAFLAEQERRRSRGLGDEIYDVTAWSLPLMFGVDAARCNSAPGVAVDARGPELVTPSAVRNAEARYGFLVAPGSAQPRFLAAALQAGLTISSADKPFAQNGRDWPAGTLILPKAGAPADLVATLNRLAADTGAEVVGTDESWVDSGASFGSGDVVRLRAPRIALAWDSPAAPDAAGATRWTLEQDLGYPVTAIRAGSFGEADLSQYQVLILPEGRSYKSVLGEDGVKALHDWVSRGGTLISLGTATRLLTDADSHMLASRRQDAAEQDEAEKKSALRIENQTDYAALLAESGHGPDSVAGVLARAHVDPDHWIGAGLPSELNVLVRGADIYAPLKRGEGSNAVRFEGSDTLLASGQLWAENQAQLGYKPVVMIETLGAGQLIAFTQDPTVRGYLEGLKPLFANAVFKGPAHVSPRW
ncbi:M14 family metallopeptidase [Brevundimonas sp.]|jgi:hypothetical protein|uniref:M14 family metallopeptidase n=1 Tax=Brevundimonas sp. TaxID=1871086 RepID=UPI0037C1A8F0